MHQVFLVYQVFMFYIKVYRPTLNDDLGRYKLPGVCESVLRSSVSNVLI